MTLKNDVGGWQWIELIQRVCEEAGAFQMKHFRSHPPGWGDAKKEKEYVSWIDVESENLLKHGLQEICPQAGFYGEEGEKIRNSALEWVVDPLDGTTNYLSGFEQFVISVALVREGEPLLGVVYRPWSGEHFSAVRGEGARHHAEVLERRAQLPLSQALVATGFPYRSPDLVENFFNCTRDVLQAARGIRRTGTAALDLAYIAAGFLQGFWEPDLQAYDVAAALLLLSETGCPYSTLRQQPYRMFESRVIVAGVPATYQQLCAIVDKHYG